MAYRLNSIVAVMLVYFGYLSYGAEEQNDNAGAMGVGNSMVADKFEALNYLTAYGWGNSGGTASELIDLTELLTNFQRYTGLPETGKFDAATEAKMNSPRCGNPDFPPSGYQVDITMAQQFTTLGSTWSQNSVTWYLESDKVTTDLPTNVIRSELAAAFQYWGNVSALSFQEKGTADADILVSFAIRDHGDGNNFDGPGNVLAHAYSPGRGRGGDMHFDDDELYTNGPGTNLRQVAVHEIGHALGLGHSSDNTAIMAPFYQYRQNFALSQDDISGIQSLYGEPTDTATRPTVPTTAATQPTTTTVTPSPTLPPYNCTGRFDAAVESFDGQIYLFQGANVFKIRSFRIEPNYPRKISEEFLGAGIPDFVDAALLWTVDEQNKYMYIFKGNYYWRIYNGGASSGYPRHIRNWELPGNIHGAFRWPGNKRIYFFKGEQYYRYNTMTYRIDPGYPRPITAWRGISQPGAVLDHGEQSYFFNGEYFQTFSTRTFSSSDNFQAARTWLGCQAEGLRETATTVAMTTSGVGQGMVPPSIYVIILTSLLGAFFHCST